MIYAIFTRTHAADHLLDRSSVEESWRKEPDPPSRKVY
jgi:hypothetical protein